MTAEDRKHQERCPFWSATSVKCTICDNGLFIPLDNHAEVFCKTSRYSACMQYTLYSENHILLQEKVRKSEVNRRKFLRIESSHAITLIKIAESGDLVAQFPQEGKTIDVSKRGMRIAVDRPLVHDALVQFSFDDSFPLKVHQVTGLVEWCNKQIDEPGYHAGVSFQGNYVFESFDLLHSEQHNQG